MKYFYDIVFIVCLGLFVSGIILLDLDSYIKHFFYMVSLISYYIGKYISRLEIKKQQNQEK